jgi:hypothetical protein
LKRVSHITNRSFKSARQIWQRRAPTASVQKPGATGAAAAPCSTASGSKPPLLIIWPGYGILFFWQLGVLQYLTEHFDCTKIPMLGSSAGGQNEQSLPTRTSRSDSCRPDKSTHTPARNRDTIPMATLRRMYCTAPTVCCVTLDQSPHTHHLQQCRHHQHSGPHTPFRTHQHTQCTLYSTILTCSQASGTATSP